jgi:hypothetical protein
VVLVSRRERVLVGGGVVLASGGSQRETAAGFGRRLAAAATGRRDSQGRAGASQSQQAKRCAKEKGSKSR